MAAVVIVGAGISGMAAAYRLRELAPSLKVTLLEANDRPGGAVWTLREEGFTVEMGPNGFLDTKPTTLTLARDLGLGDQLQPASETSGKNRYLFWKGRLQRLPSSLWALLRTPLLSWRGKVNLFLERFRRQAIPEDESIDAFARRRTGAEVARVFADALVTGIYAGDTKQLSLPACFPRVAALEREHGSVLRGFGRLAKERRREALSAGRPPPGPGKLWSFTQGMRVLTERLGERVQPITGTAVRSLYREGAGWSVVGEGKDRWQADAVLLACPAHQQAALLDRVDGALAEEAGGIAYNRIAVVALGYRARDLPGPLDGFGYIAPQQTLRDLLGVQWCSSTYPGRAPQGLVLLRGLCGGWQRPEMVGWDDDRLATAVRAELRVTQQIAAAPVFQRIVRWQRAIPQYHVGHLARLTRIEGLLRRHSGLFVGGNAYRGVALNDCCEQGLLLAQRIADFCRVRCADQA